MSTNKHRPDDSFLTEQKRLFSAIAAKYDFLNHLLSFNIDQRWRKQLADCAGVQHGESILDVCTGTGDLAIRFAQADGAGTIWGVDQSQDMLRIARRKICSNGLAARIKFVEANALALPFDDESFDVVSMGFGLRNVGEHQTAIGELVRVLRKEGRLLILEFSPPTARRNVPRYRR